MIEIGQLRIEPSLWRAILGLFFHYCPSRNPESCPFPEKMISVALLQPSTPKIGEEWRWNWRSAPGSQQIVVPMQRVSYSSVTAELNKSCNLITGEEYEIYPPDGNSGNFGPWHAGEILSHNSMGPFFSGITD